MGSAGYGRNDIANGVYDTDRSATVDRPAMMFGKLVSGSVPDALAVTAVVVTNYRIVLRHRQTRVG